MAKTKDTPAFRCPAHQALAEREVLIAEANAFHGLEAQFAAITIDRADRWKTLLADREERAEIREWATKMGIVHHHSHVRIHRSVLPWITALYVAKYGEAEDFWPPQLTDDDVIRAGRWLRGEVPEGVTYLKAEA